MRRGIRRLWLGSCMGTGTYFELLSLVGFIWVAGEFRGGFG